MNTARSATLSSLLLGLAIGVTGCGDGPRPASSASLSEPSAVKPAAGTKRRLADTPFERSWDLDLKKPVTGAWVLPELPDTVIFQLQDGNELVAVDAMSGHTRWVSAGLPEALRLAPGASRVRLPGNRTEASVYDERLYAVSQDTLFCLDMASGQLVWRYELPFSPSCSPRPVGIDSGLRVFLGDWAGRLQVVSYEMAKAFPYIAWQYKLDTSLTAPAVEKEDLVYVADGTGTVHAFKLDRTQVWSFKAGGHIAGSPAIRDRILFTGTSDAVVYAIDRLTGEKLGQLNLNAPVTRAPFVFKNDPKRVYAWVSPKEGDRGGLYAIHAQADTVPFTDASRHPLDVVRMGLDWHLAGIDTLVGSTPGYLYVTAGASAEVKAVNRETGAIDWSWDAAEERRNEQLASGKRSGDVATVTGLISYQDPTDLNRSFYVIDEDGGVVAYRFYGYVPDSAEPVATQVPEAQKDEKPAEPAAVPQ